MPPKRRCAVWKYFQPNKFDKEKADCEVCNKVFSRKGRGTSSLKRHLQSMHPEEYKSIEQLLLKVETDSDKTDIFLHDADINNQQLSFQEVFLEEEKAGSNNFNSKKIDTLIGEMIALQNLPFNFVEGLGFRRLVQELAPQYNFKGCSFFTDFVCKELYGKVAEKVKELVEKFDYVSFTSNIWSDPSSNVSLLSLTCHGIAKNFDRSSILLKCETFDSCHTGDIISEKFTAMLSEWNIKQEQVHCLVRDEESNTKRAVQLAALNDIDCTVHKIQLTIRGFLDSQENIETVTQKLKNISSHFNHSVIAQEQLQSIQDSLNQSHLIVFQDFITRWYRMKEEQWNTMDTFFMFKCFLKVKDALNLYINEIDIKPVLLKEWEIIESCVELLEPFEEAIQELSSSHALISSVIPIIQMLEKKVDDYLTRSHDSDPIRQSVTALKNELFTKFSNLVENNLYAIATYLDPRYKHKFCTPMAEEKIKEEIVRMRDTTNDIPDSFNFYEAKRMKMDDSWGGKTEQIEPGTSGLTRKSSLKTDLAVLLDSCSDDETEETPKNSSINLKKELFSYRIKKRANLEENPLQWWSVYREELKLLSPIARRFLSAPPTCVPSEQLLCSEGLINEPLHHRLNSENAEILLFIKHNAPIFNFNYQILNKVTIN